MIQHNLLVPLPIYVGHQKESYAPSSVSLTGSFLLAFSSLIISPGKQAPGFKPNNQRHLRSAKVCDFDVASLKP